MAEKPNPPKYIYVLGAIAASVLTFMVMRFLETSIRKKPAPTPATSSQSEGPVQSASHTIDDIDFKSYSKELARFTGLAEGQSRGEAVDNIRLYFAPENGETIVNTTQSKFEREDGAVLLFGASGFPDDSIKAEEIYLIVQGPKGSQTLAAFGSRLKCHRGENITEWQATPCP